MSSIRGFLKEYGITLGMVTLTLSLAPISGLGPTYIAQELITRLGRNAILVLALLPMLHAGMGFNFALGAGAMAGQIGLILAVASNLVGFQGLVFAVMAGLPIAVLVGWISGLILNRMKGMEMIISYFLVPLLFDGFYQLLVLYAMGTTIPLPSSPDILLSRGYGIRNTLNLDQLTHSLEKLIPLRLGLVSIPIGTYLAVSAVALLLLWSLRTKLDQDLCTVGRDPDAAEAAGIPVDRTRLRAVIFSMALACLGQVVYLQNIGNMATYNAHSQSTLLVIPALIVGGAALRKARIHHVLIGIPVLHAFIILLPNAFLKLFSSTQFGFQISGYTTQFVGYGLIVLALVRYGMEKHREAEAARTEQETPPAPELTQ